MIEFVAMEKAHIPGMIEVEEQCFNSGFAKATFEKELENKIAVYVVAVENGNVLGYIGLWNICGTGEIMDVAVHKDHRRRGIGEGLIQNMLSKCQDMDVFEINLEVRESNTAARNLYKKMGFKENGIRKKYYENTEDAILMQKGGTLR